MGGRTHKVSEGSKRLMEEVSFDNLKKMTETFYQLAFQDQTLDPFLRSREDPHADRFARWIHQKLSDSGKWDQERESRDLSPITVANGRIVIVRDRTSAHVGCGRMTFSETSRRTSGTTVSIGRVPRVDAIAFLGHAANNCDK